jgi:hypothetical protein
MLLGPARRPRRHSADQAGCRRVPQRRLAPHPALIMTPVNRLSSARASLGAWGRATKHTSGAPTCGPSLSGPFHKYGGIRGPPARLPRWGPRSAADASRPAVLLVGQILPVHVKPERAAHQRRPALAARPAPAPSPLICRFRAAPGCALRFRPESRLSSARTIARRAEACRCA